MPAPTAVRVDCVMVMRRLAARSTATAPIRTRRERESRFMVIPFGKLASSGCIGHTGSAVKEGARRSRHYCTGMRGPLNRGQGGAHFWDVLHNGCEISYTTGLHSRLLRVFGLLRFEFSTW